ncbi:hypothetical protein TBK1r_20240 [Stieleria magnilauensis]|uniref:Uncharacterized protein n=1 Tax=Stieleria magnilauensis TaxID=2527963 RepID=A0ABX5XME3_9BACT|nr:hypothetical protein TBK1r_20240 [Planctomycetes bacterium TBK1r]
MIPLRTVENETRPTDTNSPAVGGCADPDSRSNAPSQRLLSKHFTTAKRSCTLFQQRRGSRPRGDCTVFQHHRNAHRPSVHADRAWDFSGKTGRIGQMWTATATLCVPPRFALAKSAGDRRLVAPQAAPRARASASPRRRPTSRMAKRGVLGEAFGKHSVDGEGETRRQGDKETRRQGDKETRRQGDKETRRQGDKEMRR